MEGYWKIGFAHAPVKKNKKFLPMLSSEVLIDVNFVFPQPSI